MEQKFEKNQDKVLYNIARALKFVKISEILELLSNSLTKKQVQVAILNLENRRLILRKENLETTKGEERLSFGLNTDKKPLERTKKIINIHWESDWENKWKEVFHGKQN